MSDVEATIRKSDSGAKYRLVGGIPAQILPPLSKQQQRKFAQNMTEAK